MEEKKELELMLDETLQQFKQEHTKILKLFQDNGDKCFGEGTNFATIDEYNIALSALSNALTYTLQLNQAKAVQKAQREKDNVVPLKSKGDK